MNSQTLALVGGAIVICYLVSKPPEGAQWNFDWVNPMPRQPPQHDVNGVPYAAITHQGQIAQLGTKVVEVWTYPWRLAATTIDTAISMLPFKSTLPSGTPGQAPAMQSGDSGRTLQQLKSMQKTLPDQTLQQHVFHG